MIVTDDFFQKYQPDPHANPNTGGMGTLSYTLLTPAEKKVIADFMQRCINDTPATGDGVLLGRIAPYLPAMARSMSDEDLLRLVLNACSPRTNSRAGLLPVKTRKGA